MARTAHRPNRGVSNSAIINPFSGFSEAYREAIDPRTRPGHVITFDQMPEAKRQEMIALYGGRK